MANIDELFGGRCIWCQRLLVDVGTDSSHVYPAMLGFGEQMVLPPGVVCCECNNHFGQQAEVTFADDPQLHIRAVSARVPNRRHRFREELFDDGHPAVDGVAHSVNVSVRRQDGHSLRFDVTHALTGAMVWRYDRKRLTFLSRVVHKIAFESLAWSLVENASAPDGSRPDLHSAEFDPIRRWGRESQGRFRPVLRWSPDPFDSLVQIVPFEGGLIFSGLILGEGYAAAITGPNGDALRLLDAWAPDNVGNILVLGREIVGLATHRGQPESVAAGSVDLQFVVAAESVTVAQNGNLNVANVFTDIYPSGCTRPSTWPLAFVYGRRPWVGAYTLNRSCLDLTVMWSAGSKAILTCLKRPSNRRGRTSPIW